MKRPLALILTLCLCLGLYACAFRLGPNGGAPPSSAGEEAEADLLPDNAIDVAQELAGIPGSSTLLTVDGQSVTAEEYLYWLGYLTSYYETYALYYGQELDLDASLGNGLTWGEQIKEEAKNNCVLLALVPALAQEYGAALTEEEVQKLVADRASSVESAGGEANYAYQLQRMGVNDSTVFRMDRTGSLFAKVQDAYVEAALAEGGAITDEAVERYAEENDLLRAKHILLLTRDMSTGEAYDAETQARQREKAEDLLGQLRADPDRFDELMNANSEDSGLSAYPDGYLFSAGEMVEEFEAGTRALAYDQISEIVESDYGYHIIRRLDPDCEETRRQIAQEQFDQVVQDRVDAAQVTTTDAYEALSAADYYDKLQAFWADLPDPTQDESAASLQPDETDAPASPTAG